VRLLPVRPASPGGALAAAGERVGAALLLQRCRCRALSRAHVATHASVHGAAHGHASARNEAGPAATAAAQQLRSAGSPCQQALRWHRTCKRTATA
jgi:hypothetical protein